jgi:hypothetical protein
MKLFIILSLAFAHVIGAETFKCDIVTHEKFIYHDTYSYALAAVYLDGILRGRIIINSSMARQPKLDNPPNHSTYIVAEGFAGVVIKSVSGYIRQYAGKRSEWEDETDIYPYYYMLETDTFYMPLSENELRAIQFTDDSGRKCLQVYYSSTPYARR